MHRLRPRGFGIARTQDLFAKGGGWDAPTLGYFVTIAVGTCVTVIPTGMSRGHGFVVALHDSLGTVNGVKRSVGVKNLLRKQNIFLLIVALLSLGSMYRYGVLRNVLLLLAGEMVVVDSNYIVLGEVKDGEERHLEFVVRNLSFKGVEIIGAKASCSCTVAQDIPVVVRAMGSSILRVSYRAQGKVGGELVRNRVLLFLDNGQEPLQLDMSAIVK